MNTFLPSQSGLTSAEEREGRTRGMTGLQSKGEFTEMIRALKRENVALMADQGLRLYNMKQKHCDSFFSDCT